MTDFDSEKEQLRESNPDIYYSHSWTVQVMTDAFDGEMRWVHFMSGLEGPQAWRISSTLSHTFRTASRMINEGTVLTCNRMGD